MHTVALRITFCFYNTFWCGWSMEKDTVILSFYSRKKNNHTYCMKSFHKLLITKAIFGVKPGVKVLPI